MSFSINTNAGALVALQNLNQTNRQLQTTQTRINTGLAVASARDNSAVFAIAQSLRADIGGLSAVQGSLSNAQSTLDVALNAAESVSDLLNEAREIAVRAADDGTSTSTRSALNDDFAAIVEQIDSIVNQATFNGVNILRDSPDQISAVSSVDQSGDVTRLSVSGSDITSDSTNATSDLSLVGYGGAETTVAITSTLFATLAASASNDPATKADGQSLLAALDALESGGQDVVVQDANGNYSLDFSGLSETTVSTGVSRYQVAFGSVTLQSNTFSSGASATVKAGFRDSAADFATASGTQNVTYTEGQSEVGSIALSAVDLTTARGRAAAIKVIDNFSDNVKSLLSTLGSSSRQIDLQLDFTSKLSDTIQTGIGNLVDADLAQESARLQALQTKQQLGLQALSIANQAPASILSLFR